MSDNSERELYQEIDRLMKDISGRFKEATSETVILSLSGIAEQEHVRYYIPVRNKVLPLLAQLFKINRTLAEQFVTGRVMMPYKTLVMEEMRHFFTAGLSDVIAQDLLAAHTEAYAQYKTLMMAARSEETPAENTDNLDFTPVKGPNPEEKKMAKLRELKVEKYIKPFIAAYGVKFVMLVRESPQKAHSLLIQIANRDMQVALCARRSNPTATQVLKDFFLSLAKKSKEEKKPLMRDFVMNYFYQSFDPDDITQKNKLSLEVMEDPLKEAGVLKEVLMYYN